MYSSVADQCGAKAQSTPTFEARSHWLRGYQRAWLAPDIIAGLTAAAVVLPMALAYAAIAGLPLQVGLYTALVPMVAYALTGSSSRWSTQRG